VRAESPDLLGVGFGVEDYLGGACSVPVPRSGHRQVYRRGLACVSKC